MTYELSPTDIGFLCVIIKQPFPLFIEDPFTSLSSDKMEKQWMDFCESSYSKGFLKMNEEGNPYIVDDLMAHLAGIFTAEKVITVIKNEVISTVIYIGEDSEKNVVVKVCPNCYLVTLANSEGFHSELLTSVSSTNRKTSLVNEFKLELSLPVFERLLAEQETESLLTHCENLNLPPSSICTILNGIKSRDTTVYLTESLRHRETRMTIVANESGNIKTATTVYSDMGDKVILRETKLERLPLLLTR